MQSLELKETIPIANDIIETKVGKYFVLNKVLGIGTTAECKLACLDSNEKEYYAVKIIDKRKLKKSANENKVFKSYI